MTAPGPDPTHLKAREVVFMFYYFLGGGLRFYRIIYLQEENTKSQ